MAGSGDSGSRSRQISGILPTVKKGYNLAAGAVQLRAEKRCACPCCNLFFYRPPHGGRIIIIRCHIIERANTGYLRGIRCPVQEGGGPAAGYYGVRPELMSGYAGGDPTFQRPHHGIMIISIRSNIKKGGSDRWNRRGNQLLSTGTLQFAHGCRVLPG